MWGPLKWFCQLLPISWILIKIASPSLPNMTFYRNPTCVPLPGVIPHSGCLFQAFSESLPGKHHPLSIISRCYPTLWHHLLAKGHIYRSESLRPPLWGNLFGLSLAFSHASPGGRLWSDTLMVAAHFSGLWNKRRKHTSEWVCLNAIGSLIWKLV